MKSNRPYSTWLVGVFTGLILLTGSCHAKKEAPPVAEPTGIETVNILVDPGLLPVMEQQQYIYEAQHDSVKLTLTAASEADMIAAIRSHKTDMLVIARFFTTAEKESLKNNDTLYLRETAVAHDAVALIGNLQYDDSNLDTIQLRNYFSPANSSAAPRMVFDNRNSSVVSYMLNYLGYSTGKVSGNMYAVQSPEEVINYVAENKNAIGFIPYGMVADADDDAQAKKVLERVKILSLRAQNEKGKARRTSANQSDIADGSYPLTRIINTAMPYTYESPAWRFVNFLSNEKGARIFLKAGLVPMQIPYREIDVNTDGYKGRN